MHHPKEAVIDGVKFVLIPEELHDELVKLVDKLARKDHGTPVTHACVIADQWELYDPEVFK